MSDDTSDILYRRLQQHLDRMPVGFPATASGVELRILRHLFTPEEAAVALELSAIPEPAATIHKRLPHMTLEELTGILDRMGAKGIILFISPGGPALYAKLIFAIGMYERQINKLTPEFERDTLQYLEEGFDKAFHTGKTPQLRVVPVNRQVAVERAVTTYDQLRAYIDSSPGPFATIPCICRRGKEMIGEPCKQTAHRDNCMMIGMAATWAVDSGTGRPVTRQEFLDLLDCADRDGLVLEPENTKAPLFVCCCCGCCCGVLGMAKRLPSPASYFSSNFYAEADATVCSACGLCETRCQMDAVTSPDGTAVVDRSRCIGCALCVSTCPSGAMQLKPNDRPKIPPDNTMALYRQLLSDRYGPIGMLKIGLRRLAGMKI